jgi:hypothetical protein
MCLHDFIRNLYAHSAANASNLEIAEKALFAKRPVGQVLMAFLADSQARLALEAAFHKIITRLQWFHALYRLRQISGRHHAKQSRQRILPTTGQ